MATNNAINSNIPIATSSGGTGQTSFTSKAVLLGASPLTVSNVGTNGQLLLGSTGANPAFATLTSTAGSITYVTGSNTLNIDVTATSKFLNLINAETNATGDGTNASVGAITATTSITNVGSNMTAGNGAGTPATYTAPNTGTYRFNFFFCYSATLTTGATTFSASIVTTARTYTFGNMPTRNTVTSFAGPNNYIGVAVSTLADMTAGDTAVFKVQGNGGSKVDAIQGGTNGYISGYQVY